MRKAECFGGGRAVEDEARALSDALVHVIGHTADGGDEIAQPTTGPAAARDGGTSGRAPETAKPRRLRQRRHQSPARTSTSRPVDKNDKKAAAALVRAPASVPLLQPVLRRLHGSPTRPPSTPRRHDLSSIDISTALCSTPRLPASCRQDAWFSRQHSRRTQDPRPVPQHQHRGPGTPKLRGSQSRFVVPGHGALDLCKNRKPRPRVPGVLMRVAVQCCGHQTPDIDAPVCTYKSSGQDKAPGQDATCGHRRCLVCTITFDGRWELAAFCIVLERTYPLWGYPGGIFLQLDMVDAGSVALAKGYKYIEL